MMKASPSSISKWLIILIASLILYYKALTSHIFLLYALAYILLGISSQFIPRSIYLRGKEIFSKPITSKLTQLTAISLSLIALIIHKDHIALFYATCILTLSACSLRISDISEIIIPSILIALGTTGISYVITHKPQAIISEEGKLLLTLSLIFLALSITIPSFLYIIKIIREEREIPFLTLSQIITIGLLLLGIATITTCPIMPLPDRIAYAILGTLITGASSYGLAIQITGRGWSESIYHGDYLEEAKNHLIEILNKKNIEYKIIDKKAIKTPLIPTFIPRRCKIIIEKPFKAEINLERWIHRTLIQYQVGEPGLIITIKPGPQKAPKELKSIVRDFLSKLNIPITDWK